MEDSTYPNYFNVYDSRLALMIGEAAIGIDTKHAGEEPVDYTPIYKLASYLAGVVSDKKSRMPAATFLLYKVMEKHSDRKISGVDDLMIEVSLVAQELYSVQSLPRERLAALRTFCVDLSRETGREATWVSQMRRRLIA